jgi:ABC-2 type transport system ATP-binding protein
MAALPSHGGIKMNENMVRISNVSKSYGQQLALDQVTIPIKRGQICGLVGENGAGKTTLLRILCGLSIPTEGEIEVSKNLKIGSLIEAPALYQNLSAYDNLKYLGLQLGLDQLNSRVEEVLDIIGLATVSKKKKSKNFSLGMRQRLAIGMAILDQPDFLILDEPINGLDPSGIKEVRKLLLKLKEKQGMTVLISSHLLSELEQIADYFVMMSKGKVLEILEQDQLSHKMKKNIYLATNDNLRMQDVLEEKNIDYQVDKDYLVLHLEDKPMTIIQMVVDAQLEVQEIFYQKFHFEDYYLEQIGGEK